MTNTFTRGTMGHFNHIAAFAGFTEPEIKTLACVDVIDPAALLTDEQKLVMDDIVSVTVALNDIAGRNWLEQIGGGMRHEQVRDRTARQMIAENGLESFISIVEFCAGGPLFRKRYETPAPTVA